MNIAFIDAQNLILGTKKSKKPWTVDLIKFRKYLAEKYDVGEAHYFVGAYNPSLHKLYEDLQRYGYIVNFREHQENCISVKKGNVDTDIVFMAMRLLVEKVKFDKFVLVSGDGDYWRLVNYFMEKSRFEKLLAPNKLNLSSLYRQRIPDAYIDYLENSKLKIAYKKK